MVRYLCSAVVAGLLTLAAVAVVVERGYAQNGVAFPQKGGWITVVGCLQQGLKHRLVLTNATTDHVASVPDSACSAPVAEPLLEVHDTHEYKLDSALIGHWVEMSGRIERFDKHDNEKNPREFHLRTSRAVPVVVPRAAEIPAPREAPLAMAPIAPPPPAPEPKVVATTGTAELLPKTASPLPLAVLTSVLALMGALMVRIGRLLLEGRV